MKGIWSLKVLFAALVAAAGTAAMAVEETVASGASARMSIDTRAGDGVALEARNSEPIRYSSLWAADANATATVTLNGAPFAGGKGEGVAEWTPTSAGTYTFQHTTEGSAETLTAAFNVTGKDVPHVANVALGFEEYAQETELAEENCPVVTIGDDNTLLRVAPLGGPMGGIDMFTPPFTSAGTNCLSVKTTFGKPCAFALKEDKSSVEVSHEKPYYVDFLAKFTILEEPPNSVAPYATQSSGRAILQGEGMGFTFVIPRKGFVCYIDDDIMLWRQEELDNYDEPVGTNWWVRAGNGNGGTTDYKLTSMGDSSFSVGDDDWYRVTFKACRDEVSGKLFFNIFLNGKQVRAGDTTDFPSMTDRTSIATVRFEGRGNVDNIVSYDTPSVCIRNVTAKQRYPWNGKVDITCEVTGIGGWTNGLYFVVSAVDSDAGTVRAVSSFEVVGNGSGAAGKEVHTNGNYRIVWDARADLGEVVCSNMAVRVDLKERERVQLWANGPYWATTNIGAEKPEDYGYYFWWGDTVGYTNTGSGWISVKDGTSITFSDSGTAASTCGKDNSQLLSAGYIDSTGNLVSVHDAAHVHWGGNWRMPTYQELFDLCYIKCDWTWTTTNGACGYEVRGRGDYASNSIFLPCAGYVDGTWLYYDGSYASASRGYYWSSVPGSDGNASSQGFSFSQRGHDMGSNRRHYGQSLRPVQGFAEAQVATVVLAVDSAPFILDMVGGERESDGNEALTYSSQWDGDVNATVMIAQDGVAIAEGLTGEGTYSWSVQKAGTYTLTHTTYTNGVVGNVESATFNVPAKDIALAQVAVDCGDVTYSGSAHTPSMQSVTWGGNALVEGTDYTLAYSGNVNVGIATITLTGINLYDGTYTTNFTIKPKILTAAMIGAVADVTYSGSAFRPEPTVTDAARGVTLASGTDFTFSWGANTFAGSGSVTVTGRGNYTGSATKNFTIAKATYDMSGAAWDYAGEFAYDGTAKSVHVSGLPSNVTADYTGNTATAPGMYTAHAELTYDTANYNKPEIADLVWVIKSAEETKLREVFNGLPATIEPNGQGGWKVSVTNDIDGAELPIEIPDNIGNVTIDLNGHDLIGGDGRDGHDGACPSQDGRPAIVIVPGDGEGEPTVITIVNSGEDAVVRGGEGGAGNPGGNGAPAVEVADGAQEGVLINIGVGVAVAGGGDDVPAVIGEIGENSGTVVKATYDISGARWDYARAFEYDGKVKTVLVSGLPSGVTVASYSGNTAAKPGTYTAHVEFAYDAQNYNEPTLGDLKWAIKSPYKLTLKPNSAKYGTASGSGTYAYGAKATLKAKAKKGYVFAGWFTDKACKKALNPKGYDNRKATVKYAMSAKNTTVYAKFVTKAAAKKSLKFSSATKKLAKTAKKATAGRSFSLALGISSASLPTVTAKGLPKGLKIDKTTGKITGTATVPGSYTATVAVKDAAGNKITQKVKITVNVPSWAKGTFYGLAYPGVKSEDSWAYMKFTATEAGKVSGKVTYNGKSYSFTSSYKSCTAKKATFAPKIKIGSKTFKPGTVTVKTKSLMKQADVVEASDKYGFFSAQKKTELKKISDAVAALEGMVLTFRNTTANSGLTKSTDKLVIFIGRDGAVSVSGVVGGKKLSPLSWELLLDVVVSPSNSGYCLYLDIIEPKLKYERRLVLQQVYFDYDGQLRVVSKFQ